MKRMLFLLIVFSRLFIEPIGTMNYLSEKEMNMKISRLFLV